MIVHTLKMCTGGDAGPEQSLVLFPQILALVLWDECFGKNYSSFLDLIRNY